MHVKSDTDTESEQKWLSAGLKGRSLGSTLCQIKTLPTSHEREISDGDSLGDDLLPHPSQAPVKCHMWELLWQSFH